MSMLFGSKLIPERNTLRQLRKLIRQYNTTGHTSPQSLITLAASQSGLRERICRHAFHPKPLPSRGFGPQRLNPIRLCTHDARRRDEPKLTHIDDAGQPSMVDVSRKDVTARFATATGRVVLPQIAFSLILEDERGREPILEASLTDDDRTLQAAKQKARSKGNVIETARLAAIMAAKQTSSLIPLCHPLSLNHIQVSFFLDPNALAIECSATVRCDEKTGVEMEALTAVSIGLLTVWDMLKAVAGKEMTIEDIKVIAKSGGTSGDWRRDTSVLDGR